MEHSGLLPGSVWALRFGALIVGERARERDDKANQPEMEKSIDNAYIFSLRFSPFMNPYHFAGNTDVT